MVQLQDIGTRLQVQLKPCLFKWFRIRFIINLTPLQNVNFGPCSFKKLIICCGDQKHDS